MSEVGRLDVSRGGGDRKRSLKEYGPYGSGGVFQWSKSFIFISSDPLKHKAYLVFIKESYSYEVYDVLDMNMILIYIK